VSIVLTPLCAQPLVTLWEKPQKIPRRTNEREWKEGTLVLGEGKGVREPCRGLIPVQVAIPGPLVSLPDLSFSQVGRMLDPSFVSQGGVQIHDVSAPDSSVSSFVKHQSVLCFGGDSVSVGEEFTPPSNSLFDFGGGDSWPQTCVQKFGKH